MSHKAIENAALKAELKPCPFCGGEAEWMKGQYEDGADWVYIACEECEAMGPPVNRDVLTYYDACVEAWNKRA